MKVPMLLKIENTYLSILRFAVLLGATLLLAVTAIYGLSSFKGFTANAHHEAATPTVDQKEILAHLTKKSEAAETNTAAPEKDQPNAVRQPALDEVGRRIAKALRTFMTHFEKDWSASDEDIGRYLTAHSTPYADDQAMKAAYLDGLATTLEQLLPEKAILDKVVRNPNFGKKTQTTITSPEDGSEQIVEEPVDGASKKYEVSPDNVFGEVVSAYSTKFMELHEKNVNDAREKNAEAAQTKAEALSNLYFAVGSFTSFLALVFLTIVIKIERNLRAMIPAKEPTDATAP
ncbi:hypothetical protein [Niveibacterium sp.]|uniref:hypothetical protein n=1 Tax=Niveibacterium sp. TaxID=2017444 RepID=UPI0035AF0736